MHPAFAASPVRAKFRPAIQATRKLVGANSGPSVYYDVAAQFSINMLNNSASGPGPSLWNGQGASGSDAFDVKGRLTYLTAGHTLGFNVWLSLQPDARIKPGTYVFKWLGVAVTPAFSGMASGLTAAPLSGQPNRYTLTVAQVGSQSSLSFTLKNNTGSDMSGAPAMDKIFLGHIDHEAQWDLAQLGTGDLINPDYVAALGTNIAYFRTMQSSGAASSTINSSTNPTTSIRDESYLGWANYSAATMNTPPSIYAKFCARLGCDMVMNGPLGASDAWMDAYAAQVAAVTAFTGNIYTEIGNENGFPGYKGPNGADSVIWLSNTYGPAQISSGYPTGLRGPEAEAQLSLRWRAAFIRQGIAASRMKICIALQVGQGYGTFTPGTPRVNSWCNQAMNYLDDQNIAGMGANKPYWQIVDTVFTAPYTHLSVGSVDMFYGYLKNIDWIAKSDAEIDAYFAQGQINSLSRVSGFNAFFDQVDTSRIAAGLSKVNRKCYEWGHEANTFVGGTVGIGYEARVNVANNTVLIPASYIVGQGGFNCTDGDRVTPFNGTTGCDFVGYLTGSILTVTAITTSGGSIIANSAVGGPASDASYSWSGISAYGTGGTTGVGGIGTYTVTGATGNVGSSGSPIALWCTNPGTDGVFATTLAHGGTAYIRKKVGSTNEYRLYTSNAAAVFAYADDTAANTASITLDRATLGYGQFKFDNWTRTYNFGQRLHAYLDSASGLAMYQRYYAATITPNGLAVAGQLYDFAGEGSDPTGGVGYWGTAGSMYSSNPRSDWYWGK